MVMLLLRRLHLMLSGVPPTSSKWCDPLRQPLRMASARCLSLHTNPFLSSVTPQHSGASTTLNTHTTAATSSATPSLPPRPTAAHSPATSITEPT
ncbi:uncharacterized protein UDID_20373 [Ustilago sp. UG-2017a]|nr:uncharacterized protein UDID_20373 [Ustilago sp. UG-2017a]